MFQLNLHATITFKKLPDKFLKILPGSFFLMRLYVRPWLVMLSRAAPELFLGEGPWACPQGLSSQHPASWWP